MEDDFVLVDKHDLSCQDPDVVMVENPPVVESDTLSWPTVPAQRPVAPVGAGPALPATGSEALSVASYVDHHVGSLDAQVNLCTCRKFAKTQVEGSSVAYMPQAAT